MRTTRLSPVLPLVITASRCHSRTSTSGLPRHTGDDDRVATRDAQLLVGAAGVDGELHRAERVLAQRQPPGRHLAERVRERHVEAASVAAELNDVTQRDAGRLEI